MSVCVWYVNKTDVFTAAHHSIQSAYSLFHISHISLSCVTTWCYSHHWMHYYLWHNWNRLWSRNGKPYRSIRSAGSFARWQPEPVNTYSLMEGTPTIGHLTKPLMYQVSSARYLCKWSIRTLQFNHTSKYQVMPVIWKGQSTNLEGWHNNHFIHDNKGICELE